MQNWIYDRQLTMFTTITGELSLLMLIEAYELADIHVISANTDGVTIMIKKSLIDKMHEINQWWMDVTKYELERTDYQKIIFSTVNDYIAIKTDGEDDVRIGLGFLGQVGMFKELPKVKYMNENVYSDITSKAFFLNK